MQTYNSGPYYKEKGYGRFVAWFPAEVIAKWKARIAEYKLLFPNEKITYASTFEHLLELSDKFIEEEKAKQEKKQ